MSRTYHCPCEPAHFSYFAIICAFVVTIRGSVALTKLATASGNGFLAVDGP